MKTTNTGVVRLLAVSVWCVVGSALMASDGKPVSIEDRVNGAQRVVVATALDVAPMWSQNSHGDRLIVSRVVLEVQETLKGSPTSVLSMDVEGGTIDGLTLRVSDLPEVRTGERGVFFLEGKGTAALKPYRRGAGILKLDKQDTVRGTSLRLSDIRGLATAARK